MREYRFRIGLQEKVGSKRISYTCYTLDQLITGRMWDKDRYEVISKAEYSGYKIKNVELYEGDIVRNEIMDDEGDQAQYLVCVYIKEWGMYSLIMMDEYHKYTEEGAEGLDEFMFWTFPIDEKDNEQRSICGNIYANPELLESL